MKAPLPKHEKEGSQCTICVIFLLGVLLSSMSLGSLRLYGLYLEHRLANVTSRIQMIGDRNAILEERYSALLSPSRIYTYAKSELKMMAASEIRTIKIGSEKDVRLAQGIAEKRGMPVGGFLNFFVGKANAKN